MIILKLPYKGNEGVSLINERKRQHGRHCLTTSHFNIEDDANEKYNNDLVYLSRSPSTTRNDRYIGEEERCLSESIVDHSGTNTKPHIARHCKISGHKKRGSRWSPLKLNI